MNSIYFSSSRQNLLKKHHENNVEKDANAECGREWAMINEIKVEWRTRGCYPVPMSSECYFPLNSVEFFPTPLQHFCPLKCCTFHRNFSMENGKENLKRFTPFTGRKGRKQKTEGILQPSPTSIVISTLPTTSKTCITALPDVFEKFRKCRCKMFREFSISLPPGRTDKRSFFGRHAFEDRARKNNRRLPLSWIICEHTTKKR